MFFKFGKKKIEEEDETEAAPENELLKHGQLSVLMNSSGRVNLQILETLAGNCSQTDFVHFLQHPVLAGSSIQAGELALRRNLKNQEANQTFIFQSDVNEEDTTALSEALKHAIYPLVKEEGTHQAQNIFTVGRINGNDLIIPDIAISKRHAILEIKQNSFAIRDCDSTNGTSINGARIGNKSQQIRDGDIISFARYEFTFLSPSSLYKRLTEDE
ncbi:hypothetical protein CKO09_10210 [Chromatium weissei]|nr:hypothetical protein [Chromatium weissei]